MRIIVYSCKLFHKANKGRSVCGSLHLYVSVLVHNIPFLCTCTGAGACYAIYYSDFHSVLCITPCCKRSTHCPRRMIDRLQCTFIIAVWLQSHLILRRLSLRRLLLSVERRWQAGNWSEASYSANRSSVPKDFHSLPHKGHYAMSCFPAADRHDDSFGKNDRNLIDLCIGAARFLGELRLPLARRAHKNILSEQHHLCIILIEMYSYCFTLQMFF